MTRGLIALALSLLLTSCLASPPPGLPPVGQASVDQSRAQCERTGGQWAGRPDRGMLCFRTPPDAGKQCSLASDCTAGCLAKSHTCAPITPLIGCQDILDDAGRLVTQCVN